MYIKIISIVAETCASSLVDSDDDDSSSGSDSFTTD